MIKCNGFFSFFDQFFGEYIQHFKKRRVFGNILDPDSEIRWVVENKRTFVLKEELGTKPRFYYFFDE